MVIAYIYIKINLYGYIQIVITVKINNQYNPVKIYK